ncbi:MAG: HD domain-containing protein [Chloroflexi bacterium]|nr:HD domain-containing protein [Chloroflexota bacterium]
MEIRDPVHGFIKVMDYIEPLLNLPLLQRLRRIRQTAMANLLYPGANNTRFEHSLGCMHVAGTLARSLELNDRDIELIEKAALLHDVGHGPFSHVSEQLLVLYAPHGSNDRAEEIHEEITRLAIDGDPKLTELIPDDKSGVLELLKKPGVRSMRHDIISGPFDADKLDYLLRDSHYAGVQYGTFDLERIVNTVTPIRDGAESYMGIKEDGFWAVEQMLLAKHHMNLQVYRHRVRLITDAMLVRAVEIAFRDDQGDIKKLYTFSADSGFIDNYMKWDDYSLIRALLDSSSQKTRQYAERLVERRLLKVVYSRYIKEFRDELKRNRIARLVRPDLGNVEQRIAEALSRKLDKVIDPEFIILDIRSFSNPTFRPPGVKLVEGDIIVEMQDGTRKNAINYPNTIYGTVKEPEQEMVNVYMPVDGMSREQRKSFISAVENDISQILEGV